MALFGITLGAFYRYPQALEALHTYRGRHLLNEARLRLQAQQWKQAGDALTAAIPLMPDHPEMLRVLVEFLQQSKSNPLLLRDALLRLKEQGKALPDDAVRLARALFDAREIRAARTAFGALAPSQRASAPAQKLEEDMLLAEGHGVSHNSLLTPEVRLTISESSNTFPDIQKAALARLWELTRRDDTSSLQAINYLSCLESLTASEVEDLVARIDAHPYRSLSARLGVYSGLIRVLPQRRRAVLESLMSDYRNAVIADLKVFLQWLALEGEAEMLRSLVTTDSLYQDAAIFTTYAQSLVFSGHWVELRLLLTDDRYQPPVSVGRVQLWLAEVASHEDSGGAAAEKHLKACLEIESAGNQQTLLEAGKLAEKLSLPDLALAVYDKLADSNQKNPLVFIEHAAEVAAAQGMTVRLVGYTRSLCKLRPESQPHQLRLRYLELLQGMNLEIAPSGKADTPADEAAMRLIQALAAYRLRDLSQLKKWLADVQSCESFLTHGQKAVLAGLLAADGQMGTGFQIVEALHRSLLLPEEQIFLDMAQ